MNSMQNLFSPVPTPATLPKPALLSVTVTSSGRFGAYALTGPPDFAHRGAQPSIKSEADALIATVVFALQAITPKRETQQLALWRAWTTQQLPSRADSNIPRPLLLPVNIVTSSPELIQAAVCLRAKNELQTPHEGLPSLQAMLQGQLQRFDVKWHLVATDNPQLTALITFAERTCVPSDWVLLRNEVSEREYRAATSSALALLSREQKSEAEACFGDGSNAFGTCYIN